jgi:hypothetical protein
LAGLGHRCALQSQEFYADRLVWVCKK